MELPSLIWPCTLSELSILLKDCTLELWLVLIFNFGAYHFTKFCFFSFAKSPMFPKSLFMCCSKVACISDIAVRNFCELRRQADRIWRIRPLWKTLQSELLLQPQRVLGSL